MTDFYDVEKTLTSLGTGEALVTVLSPRGVPTPLAATRLLPPDSLMAPIDEDQFRGRHRREPAPGEVRRDRRSRQRLRADHRADRRGPAGGGRRRPCGPGVDPTTATGMNTMTPAQQQRELAAAAEGASRRPQAKARARGPAPGAGRRRRPSARREGPSADDQHRHPDRR